MSDYTLWTRREAAGPWAAVETGPRHRLAELYYRARELLKAGQAAEATVWGSHLDPNSGDLKTTAGQVET